MNGVGLGGIGGINSGVVEAAVADGSGNVYIGGQFSRVGNVFAANIAEWNGRNSWSALGGGVGGGLVIPVYALAVAGTNLYAGGGFTSAGGRPAYGVAEWNGNSWSALSSSGLQGGGYGIAAYALAVSGTNLYVGGNFTSAGGVPVNYIARWNGFGWSALSSGMNNYVRALAVLGTTPYAGGQFTTAGERPANYIAQWNGNNSERTQFGHGRRSLYRVL